MTGMTSVGLAITGLTTAVLMMAFFRRKRGPLPAYGWAGLIALIVAECLMLCGFQPVATYFTPVAWTCYILLADAAVFAIRGCSRLQSNPGQFTSVVVLSVPLWLIFEAYNLRLHNWVYTGVPQEWPLAVLGYGWSFATITPGIFETSDLIGSFGWFQASAAIRFSSGTQRTMMLFGALCLITPLTVAQPLAARLFFLVWIGFVFLLDPWNYRHGLPSLMGYLAEGRRDRFYSLLAAGFVCGWLWEFWNYWASAKWHYIFPMFQSWKIFEMPAPGYLGFLPFALECFAMYVTAAWLLRLPTVRAYDLERGSRTEA